MADVFTNDEATNAYLQWLGRQTRARYHNHPELFRRHFETRPSEEEMGRHDRPEDDYVLNHRGYKCEGCNGFWAALEPGGGDRPEELPCLATEGCEGPVVALYRTHEPVPAWVPVIIQGGKTTP